MANERYKSGIFISTVFLTINLKIMKGKYFFVQLLNILFFLVVYASGNARDVYLIIGQSNAAGRGTIETKDEVALNGVDLFNGTVWESATNPMNAYSSIRKDLSVQELSYAYTFGRTVNEATGVQLGLVVNARGGTKIQEWTKGAAEGYYEAAIAMLNAALQTPNATLKVILWHQGEGNRNDSDYLDKLEVLINDFRTDLNAPNLPFIAGQLSQERTDNANFNALIQQLPNEVSNTDYVSSDFLSTEDETHFDSNAQRILGGRYAAKILEMVYGYQLKTEKIWVSEDAYTRGGTNSDTNYGGETLVRVKELSGGISEENNRRGLLKFDLNSVNGVIIDANLFVNSLVSGGTESMDIAFYETTTNWTEGAVTTNNTPAFTNKIIVSTIAGSSNAEREIYLSEYVQEQYAQASLLAVGLQSDTIGSEQLRITTKEDTANQTLRPYLLVSYMDNTVLTNEFGSNIKSAEGIAAKAKFKNPVSSELIINYAFIIEEVNIYNLLGALIRTKKVNDFSVIINVEDLKPGNYILELKSGSEKTTRLFVKQ